MSFASSYINTIEARILKALKKFPEKLHSRNRFLIVVAIPSWRNESLTFPMDQLFFTFYYPTNINIKTFLVKKRRSKRHLLPTLTILKTSLYVFSVMLLEISGSIDYTRWHNTKKMHLQLNMRWKHCFLMLSYSCTPFRCATNNENNLFTR